MYYLTLTTIHIVFASIWLINFVTEPVLRKQIVNNKNKSGERKFIILYLMIANLLGMIGALGILITGISLVLTSGFWGFFQFSANHWLAAKQVLMVVLLVVIGAFVIPTAKNIRREIGTELENSSPIPDAGYKAINKMFALNMIINIIVLINFLFAITHRYIG